MVRLRKDESRDVLATLLINPFPQIMVVFGRGYRCEENSYRLQKETGAHSSLRLFLSQRCLRGVGGMDGISTIGRPTLKAPSCHSPYGTRGHVERSQQNRVEDT
jgi:hypothetical protein